MKWQVSRELAGITLDDKKWMIWMWKGRYGITIGAEIGVYIYSTTFSFKFTLYLNGKNFFKRIK
jgi:hypothetical protein